MLGENRNILDITEEEIQKCYEKITAEEEQVERELNSLLSRQCHLEAKVKNITKVLPNLEIILSDSKQLSEMISFTSVLAENVSAKVRKLDTARSRVSECQQRVHDLLDLQLCSDGVQKALAAEDYEKASAHIHRFLSMDQRLLAKTADDMQQDCISVSNSLSLLQEAWGQLKDIVTLKFKESVQREDAASVERFFKIFPLLGMHDYGLDKFALYLARKVEISSKKNLISALQISPSDKRAGVIFADTVTLLFEDVARMIEVHHPLVETYYGPGHLIIIVRRLEEECERGLISILSEMRRERGLEKGSLRATLARDPKDLDPLLDELTIIHSRYNLYTRFIQRKIKSDRENENGGASGDGKDPAVSKGVGSLLKGLEVSMQDLLGVYLRLESYYMEESVRKAIAMDTLDQGSLVSSMLDDSFFIVRKCIRRASSAGSIDGSCAVINNACAALETQLCSALMQSMRQGFPTGYLDLTQAYNVMIQGRLQAPSDTEAAKLTFIAHLNNTEVGAEYVGTLCSSLSREVGGGLEGGEGRKVEGCLSGLSGVSAALGAAQELGLQQLRSAAVKPRIAPWVDYFTSMSHNLNEEEFSSYEANEPFIRSLIGNLDNLLSEFKSSLTPGNYENLVGILATEVSSQMEKVIMKTEFNRLGGLALDKEVRGLVSYLSKATSWSVRDKLARLTQLATLLNLERVAEISDYWGTSSLPWRLTPSDVKKVLKLRVDFRSDEIARLKL